MSVYIPENNGSGFLNKSGFVVSAYTLHTNSGVREKGLNFHLILHLLYQGRSYHIRKNAFA